ncbi:MAG: WhiB family transcriptional regulator [Acidimicrobiales bacterium]
MPLYSHGWSRQPWMEDAACLGQAHLFFGPVREREDSRLEREGRARSVCMGCRVLGECRAYARRTAEVGFWGGENDEERAAARRSRSARSLAS